MTLWIKICGLTDHEALDAALDAGADAVGFVFFPRSPRNVPWSGASALMDRARQRAETVALLVDPTDGMVDQVVRELAPDMLQLHGRETADRVRTIRSRAGIPIMKAHGVARPEDLASARRHAGAADRLLLDAKPPEGAVLPGGNGLPFDWALVANLDLPIPFVLSGGLDPLNVAEAVRIARPTGVDVSSGVEIAPGTKSPQRIASFVAAARAAADVPERSSM